MSEIQQEKLGKILWNIANTLRGSMHADDFRDYMLSFLFLRYISDNYEEAVQKELGKSYQLCVEEVEILFQEESKTEAENNKDTDEESHIVKKNPLALWYEKNQQITDMFETQMRNKVHYVIKPDYLWSYIYELARTQNDELLKTLENGFKYIENESFESAFRGLFSEINLNSEKLGKNYTARNKTLCNIIKEIGKGLLEFTTNIDILGDAYEYLIGQFAAGSGQKAGEFYTPKNVSEILAKIVTNTNKKTLKNVFDPTCGSGSLLLSVHHYAKVKDISIGHIYGQEFNITTFNLARMNMLLHGVKDTEFSIHHGDSLKNDWNLLNEMNPAKKITFDAIVANPPFSFRWNPTEEMRKDFRFNGYGLAPKSSADFAFLLHAFHFLDDEGTMAIILPHGVLFRGGAEESIRSKLLKDGNIDAVIGLAPNLFYSTGIPVCILVLKKCKVHDDILFINASGEFQKGKRQNNLAEENIDRIIETYKNRTEIDRFSRRISPREIEKNNFNLNISRYIDTAKEVISIDIKEVETKINTNKETLQQTKEKFNSFLKELNLKEFK